MANKDKKEKEKETEAKDSQSESFDYRNIIILILAGGIAGIGVDFALFPVDTIKTRFMASSDEVNYSDTKDWTSMYDGLLSSMIASFPSSAAFMLFYEFSQYVLKKNSITNSIMSPSQ